MIRGIDKLDLLGVKYDAELEYKRQYDIAEKIYNSWKDKSESEKEEWENDVYEYSILKISEIVGYDCDDVVKEDTYDIWKIIEKEFLKGE